ncbi:MAG: chemotaxis-specific protein-glutamate methyltransferase CheB [Lachnospiraceae bacterium]|nr:chemotaxis-specific protein-glutamate methyltransferase CheB [Lachnospiraceae bacterium]MBR5993959.1 chemotaxis-specific protein-glutamate methyltransferase CheB [Lachnospiraceae bacterium]
MKNILVVDDSALMRSVICDIINSDSRFRVVDRATNGEEALALLERKTYDAVVLDVNMPKMNGLELLKALRDRKIAAKVVMASTDTRDGAKTTLDALSLGAIDFVHKPDRAFECKNGTFDKKLMNILDVVCHSKASSFKEETDEEKKAKMEASKKLVALVSASSKSFTGKQIVALASSTGGPKALQEVVPKLPKNLKAPMVIVQHMPAGFTQSLADRLNDLSEITVTEAKDGEILENGHVYISKGGKHLNLDNVGGKLKVRYSDEPTREGVKPCANYMYESLATYDAERIICVVLTGMGADGTEGIKNLSKSKKIFVIAQDEDSSTVYGMPKAIYNSGLTNVVVPLDKVAQEIIMNAGVS